MSEHLVRYAVEATPEQLLALTLEDVAICLAWYNDGVDDPTVAEAYQDLPARVAQWTADKKQSQRVTEGARQQPVLRFCLDALEKRGVDGLHRDELDLLFSIHGLIQRARVRAQFQRPLDRINPHIEAIVARRETVAPVRGLPNVSKRVSIVTESGILNAASREIRSFGGLRGSFRGPVLSVPGTLKVVGDIPDGTAVVVESGTCYVSGYVLGRLLVGQHAEVRENIAGLLIAQRGNIRARGIINRATVIAKRGRIACGSAQSPDLVYAGAQLRIRESAVQGTYFAPRIWVPGEINGGLWHVTVQMEAGLYLRTDQRPLDIVLRSAIGYEDFGEALPREATALLRSANRLHARVDYLKQLGDRQAEEAEHYANTALLYLCSGANSQEPLSQVDSLKRRRAFLVRVILGLHLLTKSLTGKSGEGDKISAGGKHTVTTVQRAIAGSLSEVTAELAELKLEGNYPVELDREWEELMTLHASSTAAMAEDALSRTILRFHESRKAWQEEVMRLEERIASLGTQLSGDDTRKALLQRAQAEGTSQPLLLQLVKAALQRGPEDSVRKRLETPFVRRMMGLLKKRNEWLKRYEIEAREKQAELGDLRKKLHDVYGIDPAAQKSCPSVEGIFREGVRLHAEELHPAGDEALNGDILVTTDSGEHSVRYGMRDGIVARLPG